MLARAARRKLRRDAFRPPTQLCGQLTLPWLCPAQMRWAASVGAAPASPTARDSRNQRPTPSLPSRLETRSLATAADIQSTTSPSAPFGSFMQPWATRSQGSGPVTFESWDPSNPLILPAAPTAPMTITKYGIGGDPIELYQNLHACLRVGRMDRATAIVERLATLYDPSAPEVIKAHNIFLQTMLELAQQDPMSTSMNDIEEWYDTHVVRQAIEPNAETLTVLLRASMSLLEGHEMDESIQKYLNMAQDCGPDVVDAINDSADFTDSEWDTLIRAQPERFNEPPTLAQNDETLISTPAGYASLVEHGFLPNLAHTIKPVQQKGAGLDTLKKSLSMFDIGKDVAYPHEMEGSKEEKDRAYAYMRQVQLERDATTAALERWKAEDEKLQKIGIHGVLKTKPLQALLWNWYSALLPLVKQEFASIKEVVSKPTPENMRDDRHKYGPYLEQCSPEKVAALAVSRVIVSCAKGTRDDQNALKVCNLTPNIGEDIEQQVNLESKTRYDSRLQKQRKQARKALLNTLARTPKGTGPVPESQPVHEAQFDSFSRKEFPTTIKARIGAMVLELVLQSASITVTADDPKTGKQLTSTQSAFHHTSGFIHGKRVGFISPHPEIMSKLQKEPLEHIATAKLPMVFEPKPWSGFDDGGYYLGQTPVIRIKGSDGAQQAYANSAIANSDMDKVLRGLDVLGKVPWQINEAVFDIMARTWNSGEGIGSMVPEKVSTAPPPEPSADATTEERKSWMKQMKEYDNMKSGHHSQRCFLNFQLEIARAYLKEEKIYFPHSVDFRGRAYPIPPILNHIGSDFARGLLRFTNGKELGIEGLQWLKIHLANLYGYDKASLREREQFAMDNISEVYDSAINPLNGRRWWTNAEDPWQTLACCIELKNALESPDPTRFISHLPVHQDGTCNGLQHYAALGGDHAGASQVNLEPSDRPQDIYTGVAELVKDMVAEDAANGHAMAKFVDGKISRKVVKRTVMTNVYGVTFMGAKLQVLDELKAIFPNFQGTKEFKTLQSPALYIALKIFAALGKIFNGAQEIQYWLGECGERITTSLSADQIKKIQDRMEGKVVAYDAQYKNPHKKISEAMLRRMHKKLESFKTSIIWTTPLKMPVVQPYRKDNLQCVRTKMQEITVMKRSPNNAVDKRKQLQAFPPNFIHSLDASHMLLSAIKCNEIGIDFAAVHDSFWTHASDIPKLGDILRDAFVRMHSEDITGRLAAEFKARYAGSMYRATLRMNSPAGRKIVAWRRQQRGIQRDDKTYVYRDASFEEVALEAKRQELLNSEDAEKREEGKAMVTPTSIWLANQDLSSMASSSPNMSVLGETKPKSSAKVDEVKEKILAAEVDAVQQDIDAAGIKPADVELQRENTVPQEELEHLELEEAEEDAEYSSNPAKRRAALGRYTLNIWLPLTFPPVPKKGSWDVSRLRESKYFFS